jgi:predicted ATP-grasp superfamily ATP-dependent carboligase
MFDVTGAERHGFYTVDLKEDGNGLPFVTEINVRHVAFTQCLAMAGANLCEDTIRLLDSDGTFTDDFVQYQFESDLIFLRDVDERPIVMKETALLKRN